MVISHNALNQLEYLEKVLIHQSMKTKFYPLAPLGSHEVELHLAHVDGVEASHRASFIV